LIQIKRLFRSHESQSTIELPGRTLGDRQIFGGPRRPFRWIAPRAILRRGLPP